jgi:hypothetical protein
MPFSSRRIRAAVLGSFVLSTAGLGAIVAVGVGAPDADRPDLTALLPGEGTLNPNARWIDTTEIAGRTLYRFDSVILNNGPGALEVIRKSGTTYQRTWAGGTPGTVATDRPLALGGPGQQNALRYSAATGHNHFHSQRIAAYELRTTSGAPVASSAKNLAGFCLYDSWGDEPPTQYYPPDGTSCKQGEPDYSGDLSMGISAGWGDFYASQLWDQWVDVTDVTPGTYRLYATADPQNFYEESNDSNNSSEPVDVVIPGVIVDAKSVATGAGQAIDIPLTGTVVGPSVKSRKTPGCDTLSPACMTTAASAVASWSVSTPTTGTATRTGATVRYTPPAGFSGTATLTYTGTDSRGLTSKAATVTVQVGSGGGGGGGGLTNTINRSKPKSVGLSVASLKPTRTQLRVHASGIVRPPAGTTSQVCTGKVLVRVVAGGKVVRSAKATLRRRASACRYQVVLSVPKAKIGRSRSMKITARFLGSAQLLPRNATTRTVRIR